MKLKNKEKIIIDDLLWQEIFSLREQLRISADIIQSYDKDFDKEDFLHRLKSVDYDQWIEEMNEELDKE